MPRKSAPPLKTLYTPWGERLDREHPLPEYPRPQMRRDSYLNLNGVWEYAIRKDETPPVSYDGEIVVPFSPESPLSGVNRQLQRGETLWYRRAVRLPEGFNRGRVLLHFGAVDQEAVVYLNGIEVGRHGGGYLPFACDITEALTEGDNTLVVRVRDDTDGGIYSYGKQKYDRGEIWYTAQSGIWQTVWMESVPDPYIRSIRITPCYDAGTVRVAIETNKGDIPGKARVYGDGTLVAEGDFDARGRCELTLGEDFHPWSPEDPYLYDLRIEAGSDRIESYFGMRKFSTVEHNGHRVLALNNRPYYQHGLLDQGYYSDGLYTPPSDEAMVYDIQTMKEYGFNMLRKHIKIEPLRWYYHCDRLGMLVWQDMVSGGAGDSMFITRVLPFLGIHLKDHAYRIFGRTDPAGRAQYERECADTVSLLYNCVSLCLWVPFNEGWGQFDARRYAEMVREMDPTRLVDHASGWHDQGAGDLKSRHIYYRPVRLKNDGRVLALTEFGGYSLPIPGHTASPREFGYRIYRDQDAFMDALAELYERQVLPLIQREGLSASVYTQVSDVEDEVNGLLTYDRRVSKADPERMCAIGKKLRF
jgi:hypothetical protein